MNPYDPKSECLKCGERNARDEYHSGHLSVYDDVMVMLFDNDPNRRRNRSRKQAELDATQHERECIIRTCRNCGYQWREAPLIPMEPIPLVYPEEPEAVELPPKPTPLQKIAERIGWFLSIFTTRQP